MYVVGLSGGFNAAYSDAVAVDPQVAHDAAAVLLKDGVVVAAVEEERLNRIKHCNKSPIHALRFCLESEGIDIGAVERIARYGDESTASAGLTRRWLSSPDARGEMLSLRRFLSASFEREGIAAKPDQFAFVDHHLCHAVSAYAMSGFDDCMVLTIDGIGDGRSGAVFVGKDGALDDIWSIRARDASLGSFYLAVIRVLGYGRFDEYKVMGLAPYGDRERFRGAFSNLYTLGDDGDYTIHFNRMPILLSLCDQRRRGQPFTQDHKDVAAALQEALETLAFHVLKHFAEKTQAKRLCLAGGVALNCAMNGKILSSGMFDEVFVQPAAHDAGCALGAALHTHAQLNPNAKSSRLQHVYWGPGLVSDVSAALESWRDVVDIRPLENRSAEVAQLIADGSVVGWVQGRSEFGPRALGNRSILADPRPAENKRRINAMVKKREGYRPFAPSVLAEHAHTWFDIPEGKADLDYMLFVVGVEESARERLGATTHVDGTARIQTVSKETNPRYWELIEAFRTITDVPVLLNTSFNNNVEPIVTTVEDAITCYLTTELDYLVVGDLLVEKRDVERVVYLDFVGTSPVHLRLNRVRHYTDNAVSQVTCKVSNTYDDREQVISAEMYQALDALDGEQTFRAACEQSGVDPSGLVDELFDLWCLRLIALRPA